MDPKTGAIREFPSAEDARQHGHVPVMRSLTAKETMERQVRLYAPCVCGSGKKFKFCCKAAGDGSERARS